MKKIQVIFLVLISLMFIYFAFVRGSTNSSVVPVDQLSEEQLRIIENADTDNISTFEDVKFPDGKSMEGWQKQNDPDWETTFN
jgi:hypothetical protein